MINFDAANNILDSLFDNLNYFQLPKAIDRLESYYTNNPHTPYDIGEGEIRKFVGDCIVSWMLRGMSADDAFANKALAKVVALYPYIPPRV